MTENLKREQLVKLAELLKKKEPKYRYKFVPKGEKLLNVLFAGWHKILVATNETVASRCEGCDPSCPDYFPIPEGLAE